MPVTPLRVESAWYLLVEDWLRGNGRRQVLLCGDETGGFVVERTEFDLSTADTRPLGVGNGVTLEEAALGALKEEGEE